MTESYRCNETACRSRSVREVFAVKKHMLFFLICLVALSSAGCGLRGTESSSAPSITASANESPSSASVSPGSDASLGIQASDASASSAPQGNEAVRVTIPEGYSASQIGDTLEAEGVCKKKDFLDMINTYDFTYYPLVAKIKPDTNRCYKLEGYLFPDTYDFYPDTKPQDVIGKMLRAAEAKIGGRYAYSGLSTDQVITVASIIEKEAATSQEMRKVASVIYNRLELGMKQQMDCTIHYIERHVKPNLTGDINRYNAFYNTYKCEALPAGPICNPGANALDAAVNPAQTDYLFFVFDTEGNYYYAKTYEEHRENCKKAGITTG